MTDYVATRWYRSPELILTSDYSLPVDIWAVGCIMGELIDGQPMFPGDDTLDQIFQIIKVLGPFDERLVRLFHENQNFKNLKFPEITTCQTLENRYRKKIDKIGLNLLAQLLSIDEKTRPTAEYALQHPFFAELLKVDIELLEELRKENQTILCVPEFKLNNPSCNKNAPINGNKCEVQKKFNEKENFANKGNGNGKTRKKSSHSPNFKKTESLKEEKVENHFNYGVLKENQIELPGTTKNRDSKMTESFHEKQKEEIQKCKIKNKSENMTYKTKNNQKKFCTANSTNFVIKKLNNFGFSLYNPKESTHAKIMKKTKGQAWSMANSNMFKGHDIYAHNHNQNGLFPSIPNIRLNETKTNWNYKMT